LSGAQFPDGFHLERLSNSHPRRNFRSGAAAVDQWLSTKALQQQQKRLSGTKVLLDPTGAIAGYYTLATGQIDFGDLPHEIAKTLPRRAVPIAVLAWLGVSVNHQRRGYGERLLAQALRDCWEAGETFPFIAVVLDCLNDSAKAFYRRWNFEELPGYPLRLYLSARHVAAIVTGG